jgi:hypothetical protein
MRRAPLHPAAPELYFRLHLFSGIGPDGAVNVSSRIGTGMGSVKKKRRKKIAQHKRRKHLKAMRHKNK